MLTTMCSVNVMLLVIGLTSNVAVKGLDLDAMLNKHKERIRTNYESDDINFNSS